MQPTWCQRADGGCTGQLPVASLPQAANTHTGTERKPAVRPCGWSEGSSAGKVLVSQLTKVSWESPVFLIFVTTNCRHGAATITWSSPSAEPPEGFWWFCCCNRATLRDESGFDNTSTAETSSCSFTLQVCGSQFGECHTSCVAAPSHTQLWALCFAALWCSQPTVLRGNFNTHTQILHRKHTNALTNNPTAISKSHTPVSWFTEQHARGVQLPAARCWHGQRRCRQKRRKAARQHSAHSPHKGLRS